MWASGLAGTNAILQLLRTGDHVLAIDDLYGGKASRWIWVPFVISILQSFFLSFLHGPPGTNRMLRRLAAPQGLTFDFASTESAEKFVEKMKPNTKLVWIESPTNPLLRVSFDCALSKETSCAALSLFFSHTHRTRTCTQVSDIKAIAKQVKAKNKDCILVVDNTFMTSYLQRPLELGADIEYASVTKYYNGMRSSDEVIQAPCFCSLIFFTSLCVRRPQRRFDGCDHYARRSSCRAPAVCAVWCVR